jgi:hypothetical protein
MNDKWTEKLIDAHLEAPNTAEPSLGFESRVLARLAKESSTRRRPLFWMVWASAAAVAAAVIAIMFFARPVPKVGHRETATVATPAHPKPTVALPKVGPEPAIAARRIAPKQPRREVVAATVTVRQELFPAPSPLSEQEQLALQYLRSTPRSELIAMSQPEPEMPQEINQVVPGPEVNRTLQNTNSGSTR